MTVLDGNSILLSSHNVNIYAVQAVMIFMKKLLQNFDVQTR